MQAELVNTDDGVKLNINPENELEDCVLQLFHVHNLVDTEQYANVLINDLEE